MSEILWQPSSDRMNESNMKGFIEFVERETGQQFHGDPLRFHAFSVESSDLFWKLLLDYLPFVVEGNLDPVCEDYGFEHYGWFPNLKLNYAENLLANGADDDIALVGLHETRPSRSLTFKNLRAEVGCLMLALKECTDASDVVGAYMPNIPETAITMLATTGLGRIFTSTSPDFGTSGVVDRFGQSLPKVVVSVCSYTYNGKLIDMRPKLREMMERLPSIEKLVVVDFVGSGFDLADIPRAQSWEEFTGPYQEGGEALELERFGFNHPLYIMYSSGTTGRPKCIVHSAGGILVNLAKELVLHCDIKAGERVLYFTTCGWMMWNWLVSNLFTGATTYLYEGSPGYPSLEGFLARIEEEGITHFGTSPKFLKALEESGYDQKLPLKALRVLLSTGSPLLPEQFDFIYQKLKKDLQVASISGGTDIVGCFMLSHPLRPVIRGEIQGLGLGLDVAAFDENGKRVYGTEGELVCTKSFPNRPLFFLGDQDDIKMKEAYFNRYEGVWHHGDFISMTPEGGVIIYGRSDATLNPGGVRIGTSEIYRQSESLPYIEDSICVGANREGDVDVILFVLLKKGEKLTRERVQEIKARIKENTTPRHVPKEIYQVGGIPYTRSGKKMELAVARLINGKALNNIEALANPECLSDYQQQLGRS